MKTLTLALAATALSATAALAASDIQSLDTNGDRFASYAEASAAYPALSRADFRILDVNKDNRLSSVELQAGEAQAVFARSTGAFGSLDLAAVDTDGDNFVSFFELAGAYPGLSANDWKEIDGLSGDRLTASEFYAIETQVILDQSTETAEGFVALDAVDVDGSHFASFGELSAAYPGLSDIDFDDIDLNNDNRISFTELNAIDTRTILDRAVR